MAVRQHLFGLKTLKQTAPHKGAQDAFAQGGLHLSHGICTHPSGQVENDTRRAGLITNLITGWRVRISIALASLVLKHAIDCADVEVHMLVQAGTEAVNEGNCANVQAR